MEIFVPTPWQSAVCLRHDNFIKAKKIVRKGNFKGSYLDFYCCLNVLAINCAVFRPLIPVSMLYYQSIEHSYYMGYYLVKPVLTTDAGVIRYPALASHFKVEAEDLHLGERMGICDLGPVHGRIRS